MLVFDIGKPKLLVCGLLQNKGKNYYSIITEGFRSSKALNKEKLLWSRAATPNALKGLGAVCHTIFGAKSPTQKLRSGNTAKAITTKVSKKTLQSTPPLKLVKSTWYAPYKKDSKGKLQTNLPLQPNGEQTGVYVIKSEATGKVVYVGYSASN